MERMYEHAGHTIEVICMGQADRNHFPTVTAKVDGVLVTVVDDPTIFHSPTERMHDAFHRLIQEAESEKLLRMGLGYVG